MAKPHLAWGVVRAYLRGETFDDIKEVAGRAGIDMGALAHLHQRSTAQGNGATKGQLLSALDGELSQLAESEYRRTVVFITEILLERRPEHAPPLADDLARHGWGIVDTKLVPLELFDPADLAVLPDSPRAELAKAAARFRDGDLAGAITAACGAVEAVTTEIYRRYALGEPTDASFQERCNVALKTVADHSPNLREIGWDDAALKMFANNRSGAFRQGAYVMQALRAQMGDVHGSKAVLKPLVFEVLKWAELFVRTLTLGESTNAEALERRPMAE